MDEERQAELSGGQRRVRRRQGWPLRAHDGPEERQSRPQGPARYRSANIFIYTLYNIMDIYIIMYFPVLCSPPLSFFSEFFSLYLHMHYCPSIWLQLLRYYRYTRYYVTATTTVIITIIIHFLPSCGALILA